jgi:hypothetical protein
VVRVLERLREQHGAPQVVQVDNGPEFRGKMVDRVPSGRRHLTRLSRCTSSSPASPRRTVTRPRGNRIVQRQTARRVPEHGVVRESEPCPLHHRVVA